MRMEGERAGKEVIEAAKAASYQPAVALLTAFPVGDEELGDMGADQMLVKPMHTRQLLQQLEALFAKRHGSADDEAASTEAGKAGKPAKKPAPAKDKPAVSEAAAAKLKPSSAKKPAGTKSAGKKATANVALK